VTGSSEEISAANRQTCFVYATQLHFKYVIPTGDSNDQGVFTSICRPAVPLNIRGHKLWYVDYNDKKHSIRIDTTVCAMQLALWENRTSDVIKLAGRAKKAALGTVILRYFMAKKRPDLGLAFATGKTKLKLALKVRDLGIAMQEAEKRVQAAERAHEQEMHKLKLSSSSTTTSNTSTLSLSTDLLECAEIFLLISTVSRQS
ncbi:hypothetical protein ADUPG1_004077, partial [Aduncisulcus paluster]